MSQPQAQAGSNVQTATSHRLFYLWVIMVGITVLFGLFRGPNSPYFWLWWEGGALVTTTFYTAVFYIRLFTRDDNTGQRLYKGIGDWVAFVPLFCAGAVLGLALATLVTFLTSLGTGSSIIEWMSFICFRCDKNILPLIFLVFSGICFCLLDGVFALKHPSEEVQHEFRQGFFFNGAPVTCAFLMLLLFVCRFDGSSAWNVQLKSFIGGAVAFEMLLSNTTFAILFWKPRKI
jgi:hypothetical protein